MTAPGLYRYFTSREELLRHVSGALFTELGNGLRAAIGRAAGDHGSMPHDERTMLTLKMAAACHEFRRWSLSHTSEFALIFGAPLPGIRDDGGYDFCEECALQFAAQFFALYLELWEKVPFGVPEPDEIDPGLRDQLIKYRDGLGADLPLGAMLTFLRCWMLLYGAVSMEVFGHLGFALEDASPMFEITLADIAALVGLDYPVRLRFRFRVRLRTASRLAIANAPMAAISRPNLSGASSWIAEWNRFTGPGHGDQPNQMSVGLSMSGRAAPAIPASTASRTSGLATAA